MVLVSAEKMILHALFGVLLFLEGMSRREPCQRGTVYLSDVTEHTALLQWKDTSTNVVDYKILCAGVRQYSTAQGDREVEMNTVTRFAPHSTSQLRLTNLQPNTNYSCVVSSESAEASSEETKPLLFSTLFSKPEVPESPVIINEDGGPVAIKLFSTSSKYGPIDGYEVQFHIVDTHPAHINGAIQLPTELTQPYSPLSSLQEAQASDEPVAFVIHFKNHTLPDNLTIGDSLLQGALRSGTTYCVLILAFTDYYEEVKNPKLFSMSLPSEIFTLSVRADRVGPDAYIGSWFSRHLKLSVVVGVCSSILILLYFVGVCCIILCLEMKRINKQGGHMGLIHSLWPRSKQLSQQFKQNKVSTKEEVWKRPHAFDIEHSLDHWSHQVADEVLIPVLPRLPCDNLKRAELHQTEAGGLLPDENHLPTVESFEAHILASSSKKELKEGAVLQAKVEPEVAQKDISSFFINSVYPQYTQDLVEEEATGGSVAVAGYSIQQWASSPGPDPQLTCADIQSSSYKIVPVYDPSTDCSDAENARSAGVGEEGNHCDSGGQSLQQCVSSLMFLPRGLSGGPLPLSPPHPSPHRPPSPEPSGQASGQIDQAPDLEMDLYGISYCNHSDELDAGVPHTTS